MSLVEAFLEVVQNFFGVPWWGLLVIGVLLFIAGYVDSIAGGGGLISLPAFMIVGLPTHAALATNKLGSALGTLISTWHYARSGFIQLKLALPCVASAIFGSSLGSNLVLLVDDFFLKVLLIVVLPFTAFYVMRSKKLSNDVVSTLSGKKTMVICTMIAFCVGIYDGFYGPGTGTFLMLLLTGIAQLRLDAAAGITKAINLTTNLSALAVFLYHGQVLIPLGLLAGVFCIAGNFLGSHQFTSKGSLVARPITLVVIAIFLVKVIYDLACGI